MFCKIRTTFGFGGLTGKAHGSDTARCTSILGKKAGTIFGAAIEFAFDIMWAIQLLKMLHVDVAQARMIKQEFLLGRRQVLISIGEGFHVEDLGEVI